MSQSLPTSGFRFLSNEEMDKFAVADLDDNAPDGYIMEVDLKYRTNLHNLHNSYPLAPERLTIDETMLSPLQKTFPQSYLKSSTKLTPNLRDKTHYVVHYRNLKSYLEQGLILTKIHKVLTFKQSPGLKEYIDFNSLFRATSLIYAIIN